MEAGQREEREALLNGARSLGVELGQREISLLLGYAAMVREWNQRMNLVSRRDIGNLISGHIVDSLAGVTVLERLLAGDPAGKAVSLESQARGQSRDDTAPTHPPLTARGPTRDDAAPTHPPNVMDLGSGGGLPGIPIKICLPEIELTLVESTKKKARFLETAVRELGLKGAAVVDRHSRELEKDPELRGRYHAVTARAVAELKELVSLAFPFLKAGGWLVAYKGSKAGEEAAAARAATNKMNGEIVENMPMPWPGPEKARHIVVIRKVRSLG